MKKSRAILSIFLIIITFNISAQNKVIPLDPNVRLGVLENGLTYYIRHNENPAKRAEFHFIQRIGTTVEEENERGFAHILEHLAFQGTTNFPDNSLRNYTEAIGIKRGTDLNASTGFDVTKYKISNVPTVRDGIVDSCLLILHDWSNFITLDGDVIEKTRGVIREEWRTRRNAARRMREKTDSIVLAGSRYANRSPIGTIEVIDNFTHDELRDFYRRWYRPDLQAVIVVGDIDVDKVEAKIKQLFAKIPASSPDAPERFLFPVPDNIEPIISMVTDPEASGRAVRILFKRDKNPDNLQNEEDIDTASYLIWTAVSMMNARLSEMTKKPSPPFARASANDDYFGATLTKYAWQISATSRRGVDIAFEALLEEMERVLRFGFTPAEYERAKANYISQLERLYNERNNSRNSNYVVEYIRHFVENVPFHDMEYHLEFGKKITESQTVANVNDYMKRLISDNNRVIMISGPENKKYPKEEEILAAMALVKDIKLMPYEETLSDEPLVPNLPQKGKIESINENAVFGTKELLLSNGVRVSLKKTDFKDDEIRFSAIASGGLSMIGEAYLPSGKLINDVLPLGGLGNFDAVDLSKKLTGERTALKFSAGIYSQSFTGNSTVKDVETLLQLLYLHFTAPRQDSLAYQDFLKRRKNGINNRLKSLNPATIFNDSLRKARYGDNPSPYIKPLDPDDLMKADYDRMIKLYQEKFVSDVSAYHFTFVGNIDEEILLPLVEQYIASLPATNEKNTWRDVGIKTRTGEHHLTFETKMETPKATVYSLWSGDVEYNLRNIILHNALTDIVKIIYTRQLRDKESGTYGVTVGGGLSKTPRESFNFYFRFDTDAPLVENLLAIANAELDRLTEGVSEEIWQNVKEFLLKKHEENLEENEFWRNSIQQYYHANIDKVTDYEKIINSITTNEICDYARSLFSQGNNIKVIQLPE